MDFASALNKLKRSADNVQRKSQQDRDAKRYQSDRRNDSSAKAYRQSEALNSLRQKIEKLSDSANDGTTDGELETRHVALLFITITDLPHEAIWRAFLECSDSNLIVSVLVHAKFPQRVRSQWLREHFLPTKSHRPDWGSVEITRAMIDLLQAGFEGGDRFVVKKPPIDKDEVKDSSREADTESTNEISTLKFLPPDKFIFVSETCLPLCSLNDVEASLYTDNEKKSWINAIYEPNNGYAKQLQWDKMGEAIPKSNIWKADQWIVLTRSHAKRILQIPERLGGLSLWPQFQFTRASDELYFPTALSLLGVLSKDVENSITGEITKRRVTYCDWSANAKNPATFSGIEDLKKIIKVGREEGCIFGRKFDNKSITVQEWMLAIGLTTIATDPVGSNESV